MLLYSEVAYTMHWKKHFRLPNTLGEGAEPLEPDSRPPGGWASTPGNDTGNFPDFRDQASPFVGEKKIQIPVMQGIERIVFLQGE